MVGTDPPLIRASARKKLRDTRAFCDAHSQQNCGLRDIFWDVTHQLSCRKETEIVVAGCVLFSHGW
jgi:hypothetical protein